MHIRKIIPIISTIFIFFNHANAGINLSMRICNNHWHNHWIMTPAPEVSYSSQWFWIGIDGTLGSHRPSEGKEGHVLQTRWSLTPMVKVPLFGPFFYSAGYGFSRSFRRQEIR